MTFPRYSPYAIARFDGFVIFGDVQMGMMKTGITRSPIVKFSVVAGYQKHPVYALDRLALIVYSYCQAAKSAGIGETSLQASITASWVSTEQFSNIVATHIEWHTAMTIRPASQQILNDLIESQNRKWPPTEITLPGQRPTGHV